MKCKIKYRFVKPVGKLGYGCQTFGMPDYSVSSFKSVVDKICRDHTTKADNVIILSVIREK